MPDNEMPERLRLIRQIGGARRYAAVPEHYPGTEYVRADLADGDQSRGIPPSWARDKTSETREADCGRTVKGGADDARGTSSLPPSTSEEAGPPPRRMDGNPTAVGSYHHIEHDEITREDDDDFDHWCSIAFVPCKPKQ